MRKRFHRVACSVVLAGVCVAGQTGCLSAASLLNPELLTSLGVTARASDLPGEAPAVVFEVTNQTGRTVEFLLSWRDANNDVQQRRRTLPAGETFSEVVVCPASAVTLGDVSNLQTVGARVRLGNGTENDPFVEVEPFGVLLQDGINYDCGDVVTFSVQRSNATDSGYRVFAFIRRSGAQGFLNP